MALQSAGQMSFADVYNEITGESLQNPPISITLAELGQLQNASGQTIPLNQFSPYKPDGILPTVFPDEWYRYCQTCGVPKPYLQINKAASNTANAGEFFNYYITVTNNGETSATGNIYIYDTIPNNIIISSVTGSNMTYTVAGQNVTITYTGGLGVGQTVGFYIIVKTFYSGTFYNQASCNGGGDNTIRYSNTTATTVATATYTSTKTERRDRTLQRNNCGDNGTGSFVQVWSPYFTNTYTSYISQADADTQSTALSVTQANNWLDANAQNVANTEGTCGYQYPDLRLVQSLTPSTINRFQTTTLNINIKNYSAYTNGTLTLTCALPAGLNYSNLQSSPSGWSFSINNNIITMTTTQQLPPNYNADYRFTLTGVQVGSYNFYTYANGGNIANPPVNSNSTNITINQEAVYSFATSVYNYDFDPPGYTVRAAPGDNAYYIATLTINNGNSGNDQLEIRGFIPSWINGLTQLQFDYNNTYFNVYVNPSSINQVIFTNITDNIPAGQYTFKIKFNLPLDFYVAFSVPKTLNDNLVINSNDQSVPRNQTVTYYFTKNSQFITQGNANIFWVNNYRFEVFWRLERNPYNDVNNPIQKITRENQIPNPLPPNPFIDRTTVPFVPIWDEQVRVTNYVRNIIKDWPDNPMNYGGYSNGVLSISYVVYFYLTRPNSQVFSILTKQINQPDYNDSIIRFLNCNIDTKAYDTTMYLKVNTNGYYVVS